MKRPDSRPPADLQPDEADLWQRLSPASGVACPGPERIQAAQADVLSEESAREVRAHVAGCASCGRLAADLLAWEGPDLSPHEQEQLWRRVKDAAGVPSPAPAVRRARRWTWTAAAAAVFAAAVPSYLLLTGERTHGPGPGGGASPGASTPPAVVLDLEKLTVRTPPGAALVWRDGGAPFERDLGQALAAYESGDLAGAVLRLGELSAKYPKAPAPPLYLGVAHLLLGRPTEAMPALEAASERGGDFWAPHAEWYLAVASERAGDRARAAGLLRRLCGGTSEYAPRACAGAEALAPR